MKCNTCQNLVKRRDEDGTLYDWCGMVVDSPDSSCERDCKYYQVATHGDIIRAMNDNELTDWFMWLTSGPDSNKELILDWLKSEVE